MEAYPEFIQLKSIMESIENDKKILDNTCRKEVQIKEKDEDNLDELQDQFEKLQRIKQENEIRVRKMDNDYEKQRQLTTTINKQLYEQNCEKKQNHDDWENKQEIYQRELERKDDKIELLEEQVSLLNTQDAQTKVQQYNYRQHCLGTKIQQDNQQTLVQELRTEIQKLKDTNQELQLKVKNSSQQEITIQSLINDKRKLAQLLKKTAEFESLQEFDGECHFKEPKQRKEQSERINNKLQKEVYNDLQYWVPEQAYTFVHKFRLEYNGQLTDTLVDTLLYELNCIWMNKEQQSLKATREKYEAKVNSLQRQFKGKQLLPGTSHDQLIKIKKLESQILQQKKENRILAEKQVFCNNDRYVQEVLKVVKDSEHVNKQYEQDKINHQQKVEKMKQSNKEQTKKSFKDGIQFMADDLIKYLQEEKSENDNILINKLHERIKENINII